METALLVLLIANLLLVAAALVVVVTRTRGSGRHLSEEDIRESARQAMGELRVDFATQRQELRQTILETQQQTESRLQNLSSTLNEELARERDARITANRETNELLKGSLEGVTDRLHKTSASSLEAQAELKESVGERFAELRRENETRLERVRETLAEQLEKLRQGNETKLERMRETVDEKLQGTLEKRLGESFSLVSERLEQVQKGLGEMQTLASDVGGLKRVLTNVKNRGGWGEVQLARQLEDMLTSEQYEENVAVKPGSNERVEFAVRLPGRGDDDQPVWLPIDSKFPQEDYERLLQAQEGGEKDEVEAASRTVERVILTEAKRISSKYIEPPYSTDFGIMYLPTEGLFAEVVRRPGLASRLQSEHRILITGPTTLMSLLNSLQLGFRTLAIEKRSSEVWKVLSSAKLEFQKYGQVWEKLGKQLQTAQNTVTEAGRRTRAVERRLRQVETLEAGVEEAADEVFAEIEEIEAAAGFEHS